MEIQRMSNKALNAEMTVTKINEREFKLDACFVKLSKNGLPEVNGETTWRAVFELFINNSGTVRVTNDKVLQDVVLGKDLHDAIRQAAQAGRLWKDSGDRNYRVPVSKQDSRIILSPNLKSANNARAGRVE